jgi:hypothetical protein
MPCWDLFWINFMETFPKALGGALGVLPAVLGFWGGLILLLRWQDRRDEARREAAGGLYPRVAALEGRLLRFDEVQRQRQA